METIFKPAIYRMLKLFYKEKNKQFHLREIARKIKINESSISRHLNSLLKNKILITEKEGNLKKFCLDKKLIPLIFPIFDTEKLESLPNLRKNAILYYLNKRKDKPLIALVFGSTAKGNFKEDSDLDILLIGNIKQDNEAAGYAESQTGVKIQEFIINENQFKQDLKIQKDSVLQSAISTGFPVFNAKYYYELKYEN